MKDEMIFSVCPDKEFFDRQGEIEYIFSRAVQPLKSLPGMYLMGSRWMGKTELMRRVYRRLFSEQDEVVPVYYQFKGYFNVEDFGGDYLRETLKQYLAFLTKKPRTVIEEISLEGLKRLLLETDMIEAAGLISRHAEAMAQGDHIAILRNAISAPAVLSRYSTRPVFLLLDDFDLADCVRLYRGGPAVFGEYMETLNSGAFSFVAAGSRKNIPGAVPSRSSVEAIELKGLANETATTMAIEMCRVHKVECDTEVLSYLPELLGGNPMYIKNIVWAARMRGIGLARLRDLVDVYVLEVSDGNIAFALRSAFDLSGPLTLRVARACAGSARGFSFKEMSERLASGPDELNEATKYLSEAGLVDVNCGLVRWAGDNVIKDFISYIYEKDLKGRSADEAKTSIMLERLKQGFSLQGAKLEGNPAGEVSTVLKGFNGQRIPRALLSKQDSPGDKKAGGKRRWKEMSLPHIVGCFDASGWVEDEAGPSILVARGFQNSSYVEGNEVTWIAGVKQTPLTVHTGEVENFIRRAGLLTEKLQARKVVRWMVGREGFSSEALERLADEGIYSTDGTQLLRLSDTVLERASAAKRVTMAEPLPIKEFEIFLPVKSRSELVAVRAVEEIGGEIGFDDVAIAQIKSALVEACINAFEHGEVKDGKVHVRFVSGPDRLAIHVRNVGGSFDRTPLDEPTPGTGPAPLTKRGWGIELMQKMMDEVRFERLNGGIKLVMVKYLKKKGEDEDEKESAKL